MTEVREVGQAKPGLRRYVVARTAEIPPGARLIVEVGGRGVGIYNVGGEFYALLNRCPHRAGPLCEGETLKLVSAPAVGQISLDSDRTMVVCPWHAWEFDVRTGQSYWDPAKTRGRRVPIQVESGGSLARELDGGPNDLVPGPYKADVLATSVEDDYVIVTMRESADASASSAALSSMQAREAGGARQ